MSLSSHTFRELKDLLKQMPEQDRANLRTLIGGMGDSPSQIIDHFKYLRFGSLGQLMPKSKKDKSYKQLVTDVADRVGIDWNHLLQGRRWGDLPTEEIENSVVLSCFCQIYGQLPNEDKARLANELNHLSNSNSFTSELLLSGGIIIGRLSGFQIYLLATTTMGAATNVLNITLPFVFYTTLTKSISIVLGPIGWAFIACSIFNSLFNQPNWNKLLTAIVYVSFVRNRMKYGS